MVGVAVSVPLGWAQVKVRLLTLTEGVTASAVTLVEATAVQPLEAVTVTEYVPAVVVVKLAVVWPLLQRYVTPVVVVDADTVTAVFVQVNGPVLVTETTGATVSSVTVVVARAVQPLGPVMVTV